MTVAFLFPGQGSRGLLQGLDLAEATEAGRWLVKRACAAADVPRGRLREHGGRALERTEVLQPVLTAITLALHAHLTAFGVRPSVVLGHSLGEVAAWCACGAVAPQEAVDMAAVRGRLMAREAAAHPGGLVALPSVEVAMRAVDAGAVIAAWNAPDEVLVAGSAPVLRGIMATFPAKRVAVEGPWHSPLMAGAVEELRAAVRRVPRRAPTATLIRHDGGAAPANAPPDHLAESLVRPVNFVQALAAVVSLGVATFVTVGPGAVLRALVRKNLGSSARVLTTEDAADLARTLIALKAMP